MTRSGVPETATVSLVTGGNRGIGREVCRQLAERPVSTIDFMATACKVLGIDYTKKNHTPIGRPVRIVDRGEEPIKELLA